MYKRKMVALGPEEVRLEPVELWETGLDLWESLFNWNISRRVANTEPIEPMLFIGRAYISHYTTVLSRMILVPTYQYAMN
jgi:hypothetical protein